MGKENTHLSIMDLVNEAGGGVMPDGKVGGGACGCLSAFLSSKQVIKKQGPLKQELVWPYDIDHPGPSVWPYEYFCFTV